MGFDISWIAVESRGKADLLDKAGFRDSGEEDPAYESPFCGAELPTGWFVLFANDSEFVSPKRLAFLSADCRLVACRAHEETMTSGAFCYENGRELWSVHHDCEKDLRDLSISGSPPPGFDDIRNHLKNRTRGPSTPDFSLVSITSSTSPSRPPP
ncbi:MAG TPA: hypothetical protein VL966_12110 [Alphaproteobacteria bacterium]|nr:hypothetical protein [Alphaproteobacteria bacterium]